MLDLTDEKTPPGTTDDGSEELERWRVRGLWGLLGFGALCGLLQGEQGWLGDLALLALLLAILAPAVCLVHLYAYAARHGGRRYALTQTAVAALLAPLLVGIALVPLLVISDVQKGVAGWRKQHERSLTSLLPEVLVWTLLGFGLPWIAVRELGAWGIPAGLLVGVVAARGLIGLLRARER